ncbi:MAG: UDP-N-acetylmuramoylalanyl-D-glutamate--2,6-diaminopimelate ligase [Polaromonas sp.]|nr:UDP-N-acetylmuramoylalanyl-D-glutamate--2,6-diaminopimelate ligase [Polaromonas sp.]
MSYVKPWTSHAAQLEQLEARGLQVSDRGRALEYLRRIGYYRLSGYWFAFRERSGVCCLLEAFASAKAKPREQTLVLETFKLTATFQNAVDLYVFDKQLRLLVLDALERIEVALRVDISHTLGQLDPFAYLKASWFHDEFSQTLDKQSGLTRHHEWLSKHAQLIGRSKEEFVTHNKTKYGLPLAIWVACEVWDFGTMSTLYGGMRELEQDAIAAKYGLRNGRVFATWLRSLNYLRNVCAHHSRLWNRNIVDQPKLPTAAEMPWVVPFEQNAHARARCYLLLCMVRHLLQVINPTSSLPQRMRTHLKTFPDLNHLGLNLVGMGVGANWDTQW